MRHVDRNLVRAPASLADVDTPAAKERLRARNHYGQVPPPAKGFEFKAYKKDDIVDALTLLFHKKCAYCESKYAASQPMDVEHYRPKGRVSEDETHPGYWWLALEWTNLLPSCIDCNRERRQRIVRGAPGQLPVTGEEKALAGKKDSFPIATTNRARRPGDDLQVEGALLLSPTECEPSLHLQWDFSNIKLPIVLPNFIDGREDRKGRCSIDILGLNRQSLVEERGRLLLELAVEIERIRITLETVSHMDPSAGRSNMIEMAKGWIRDLRRHTDRGAKYSAVATDFIKAAESELKEQFARMLQALV